MVAVGEPQADNHAESLDYFDEEERYLGRAPRKEVHEKGLINRHVAFLVLNQKGELLLQLRTEDKKDNPNTWDKPGGHVPSGEDYSAKEILEEVCHGVLGTAFRMVSLPQLKCESAKADLENTIVLAELAHIKNYISRRVKIDGSERMEKVHLKVYAGRYDGEVQPQPGEVRAVCWFSQQRLEREIAANPSRFGNDIKDLLARFGTSIFAVSDLKFVPSRAGKDKNPVAPEGMVPGKRYG